MAALGASLLFFIMQTASAGVVVIGNSDLSIKSVTAAEVGDIFLGKMTKLADGTPITVIEHQDGDTVKDELYDKVVGKSPSQLKAYWPRLCLLVREFRPKNMPVIRPSKIA